MEIILSIVIPIYNGEKYIEGTLDNILKCKSNKFEIILINDGSSDSSYYICKKYAERDSRITLISQENLGIAKTRNIGIQIAKGKYIAFSDQDDVISMKAIYSFIELRHDEDIIFFNTERGNDAKTVACDCVYQLGTFNDNQIIFNEFLWPMILPAEESNIVSSLGHVWSGIYKLDFVRQYDIKFKKFVSIEDDYIFIFQALNSAKSISTSEDILYRWTVNLESTTYRPSYIENFEIKCFDFYNYLHSILLKNKYYSEDKIMLFQQLVAQMLMVRMVINEGQCNKRTSIFVSTSKIKQFEKKKDFRRLYGNKFLGKNASRGSAELTFLMLKHKFFFLSVLLQRLLSRYNSRKQGRVR